MIILVRDMMYSYPSAAVLIIGDEILSGRTMDTNTQWLAKRLSVQGIKLSEARTVGDDESTIIRAVQTLSKRYDYLLTTGGIGPTPDDITTQSIARAFDTELLIHQPSYQLLAAACAAKQQPFTKARQKMALLPKGSHIIENPLTIAPGFQIYNVSVLAGVPEIMQQMAEIVIRQWRGGKPLLSAKLQTKVSEGDLAQIIDEVMVVLPEVSIGSYPSFDNVRGYAVELVFRHAEQEMLEQATSFVAQQLKALAPE